MAEYLRRDVDGVIFKRENGQVTEMGPVDVETGAPAKVRLLVGGATKDEDRLSTIKKFYPGAMPDPDDPTNFLFENPQTGRLTKYNPPGLDMGDIPSVTREVAQGVGSAAGATLGAPAGLPGIAAGSVMGAAAGDQATKLLLQAMGTENTQTVPENVGETAYVGALGLGGPVGATAQAGAAATVKGAIRGKSGAGVQEIVDAAGRFGFTPSAATATRNTSVDAIESLVSKAPGGHGPIRKAVTTAISQTKKQIDDIASGLAGGRAPEKATTGAVVEKGIDEFVGRFNIRGGQLYNAIPIAPDSPVAVSETLAKLQELSSPIAGAEATSDILRNPTIGKIFEALQQDASGGTIPFSALKSLRTMVGKKAANMSLVDDVPRGEWKQLYGALSDDIKVAADMAGPDARKAFDRANQFWKAGTERIDKVLDPLAKAKVPEKIVDMINTGAKEGPTKIRALRHSLTPDQWRVVAAQTVADFGRPTAGQQVEEAAGFSFNTFLTNWNKMNPQARDAMFGNMGDLRAALDDLVKVSGAMRESGQAFANPSGTAGASVGQMMLFGSAGAPIAAVATGDVASAMFFPIVTASSIGAMNMTGRLLTNPKFVRWLGQSTKVKPNGIGAHLGRLSQVAQSSNLEDKQAIIDYLSHFPSEEPAE